MFPVRAFRASTPAFRQIAQRRFASGGPALEGAADNAFNRERQAVKEHAAATSGMCFLSFTGIITRKIPGRRLWRTVILGKNA